MSYFNPQPKDNRKDLYDMEEELGKLKKFTEHSPFILIKGLRRTGKTSLVYTIINEFKLKAIVFDLRALPYEGKIDTERFLGMMFISINRFLEKYAEIGRIFLDIIKKIEGIQIAGSGIQLRREGAVTPDLVQIFDSLEKTAQKRKERLFLVFDEAQELRRVAKYRVDKLMAYIYDRLKNVALIVTGSEIGVVDDFLRLKDPKAPLYGRAIDEINLRPFSEEQSREFLIRGYKEYGIEPPEGFIDYAIEKLNGIPGWLTFLGWETRNRKRFSKNLVDSVLEKTSALAIEEFNHFLNLRWQAKDRYKTITKILARVEKASWKKLKTALEMEKGKINDKNFSSLLRNLYSAGFITKIDNEYRITDPVLKYGLER